MDYKEMYEQALEKATIAYKDEDRHLKETIESIFPELKESEDEMIRKELLSVVNSLVLPDEQQSRFVAWLEKQGEQKPVVIPKFRVGDTIQNKYTHDKRVVTFINKDSYVTDDTGFIGLYEQDDWKLVEQKAVEWSKEDEQMIEDILDAIDNDIAASDYHDMENWLKSLRPQNRWKPSEEQVKCLDNIKGSDDHNGYVLNTLYNDLKKLMEE